MQMFPSAMDEATLFGAMQNGSAAYDGALHRCLLPGEIQTAAADAVMGASSTHPPAAETFAGAKWLVCDGSLQSAAAHRLLDLLVGKPVMTNAGVHVAQAAGQRVIWECDSLAGASPALLSSAGICVLHEPLHSAQAVMQSIASELVATVPDVHQVCNLLLTTLAVMIPCQLEPCSLLALLFTDKRLLL